MCFGLRSVKYTPFTRVPSHFLIRARPRETRVGQVQELLRDLDRRIRRSDEDPDGLDRRPSWMTIIADEPSIKTSTATAPFSAIATTTSGTVGKKAVAGAADASFRGTALPTAVTKSRNAIIAQGIAARSDTLAQPATSTPGAGPSTPAVGGTSRVFAGTALKSIETTRLDESMKSSAADDTWRAALGTPGNDTGAVPTVVGSAVGVSNAAVGADTGGARTSVRTVGETEGAQLMTPELAFVRDASRLTRTRLGISAPANSAAPDGVGDLESAAVAAVDDKGSEDRGETTGRTVMTGDDEYDML